jgi:hypothetical protein
MTLGTADTVAPSAREKPRPLIRVLRTLAAVIGALAAIAADAQPAAGAHRIAFVNVGDAAPNAVNVAAFRRGLGGHCLSTPRAHVQLYVGGAPSTCRRISAAISEGWLLGRK